MIQIGNFGGKVIFGKIPDLPVRIPGHALSYKIKIRPSSLALIFIRFSDRIEQWILVEKDGALRPGVLQAENRRENYATKESVPSV